jgi:hypothetical protein
MPNSLLLLAAALTVAIGVAHSWIGERRLIGPLLAPDRVSGLLAKSDFARQTLRFAWHITSVAWWGMAAILVALALWPIDRTGHWTLIAIATTFLISGVTTLVVSRGRHLAWPVFLAVAGLSLAPLL